MLKSENITIPLVIAGVLILGSFAPIIQITMLFGNGALMFLIEQFVDNISESILNYVNLYFGILSLIAFYFSKRLGYKIIWAILTTFFIHGFIVFIELEFTKGGDTNPYYLGPIVAGVLATLPLIVTGYLKEKKEAST